MSVSWDKTKPAGSDYIKDSDDLIRNNWEAIADTLKHLDANPTDPASLFAIDTSGDITTTSVDTDSIHDSAVTEAKLAADAVTNAKIADGAVDTAQLADEAVETAKIADDAVTQAKIADDAVGTDQVVDDAITSDKILDDSILTGKLADGAVIADKMANDAVQTDKIVDLNVTAAKLAADAVETDKIKDEAVTQAKVADDAIGESQLAAKTLFPKHVNDRVGSGGLYGCVPIHVFIQVPLAATAWTTAGLVSSASYRVIGIWFAADGGNGTDKAYLDIDNDSTDEFEATPPADDCIVFPDDGKAAIDAACTIAGSDRVSATQDAGCRGTRHLNLVRIS